MPSAVNSKLKAKSDSSGPVVQTEEELLSSLDFSDIERKYAVELPTAFDTVVVVDNLPIIDETKEEKLLNIIKTRVFKNFTINSNNLYLPKDPASGKTKGFMFIDFDTPEIAARAVREGNGHKMDKVHILAVNMFDDIELFTNVDDEFVEPETETFVEKEHLKGWLTDEKARDQFVIMRGNDTGIYWNNKTEPPQLAHKRDGWADMLAWSPLGTYLQTFHKQGAALWGGASFTQIKKFPHVNVKLTDFSPNERYMITWSNEPTIIDGQPYHMIVWDVLTGLQLRPFVLDPSQQLPSTNIGRGNRPATVKFDWPVFKWSHDDKYVAKMVTGPEGLIQIYETPEMGLLDKKSLKVENIKDFSWMPNDHVLAYWTPEGDNIPARITLTKIPSRETLRTKNLVNVIEAKLYWQSAGDFLLVKVERAKTKKQTTTNFEIFRIHEKGIPVDVLEFKPEETITNVFWEPAGSRFAVLSQEGTKIFVSFYAVIEAPKNVKATNTSAAAVAGGEIRLLKRVEKRGINQVIWSPKGRFCVLAGIRAFQGDLEFWDVDELLLMDQGEHYMCTDVEWDPTGRFVVSSVSFWFQQSDNGFKLWSFTGVNLLTTNMPQFKQINWRPRPPTLLSKEDIKNLKKNIKKYVSKFEEEDQESEKKVVGEASEGRRRLLKEWRDYRKRCEEEYENMRDERLKVYGFDPDVKVAEDEDVEEWIEEVIEETEVEI